jgi:integrase
MRGVLWRPDPRGTQRKGTERGDWWTSYHCATGHRHRIKVGSRSQAAEQHGQLRRRARLEGYCPKLEKRSRPVTLADFSKRYLSMVKATKVSWKTDVIRLRKILAVLGPKLMSEITVEDLEYYRKARLETVSNGTVNLEVSLVASMYSKAIQLGAVASSPCSKLKALEKAAPRTQYLTLDECAKLVAACSPNFRPIVVTALSTGLRLSRNLSWGQIDLKGGWVTIPPTKKGRVVRVPINTDLAKVLRALPRTLDPQAPIFGSRRDIRRQWWQAMRRAGMATKVEAPWVDSRGIARVKVTWKPRMRFHDLRSTFATHAQARSGDLVVTQRLLGHADIRHTLRYAHVSDDRLRLAVGLPSGMPTGTRL